MEHCLIKTRPKSHSKHQPCLCTLFSASHVLFGIFNELMQSLPCVCSVAPGGATDAQRAFSLAAALPCQGGKDRSTQPWSPTRVRNACSSAPTSSLNQTFRRQKPAPGRTLPGSRRSTAWFFGPLSGASALPSPPRPRQPPPHPPVTREGHQASLIKPRAQGVARNSTSNPLPQSIRLPSPPLITPLAKGKPFHGKGCSTVQRTFRGGHPNNSMGRCKALGDKGKEHTEQPQP